ncbi:unnamed protein product [Ranitomeya imitator]|uniref:Reverse transcriptase domain-containing protein n=1 Tax=Ranitomeya imitator TaxID=111125 RepID=A0ABN9KSF6_9NEOB|nr:unnamed protein product [Ranitomeya imitator]
MVVDDEEKANILNTFFSTVFTVENEMLGEIPRNNENPILRVTNLTKKRDSIATGSVPQDWRIANVVPIFKKGSKSEPGNYRPVSLTSIVGKIFEGFLKDVILDYLNENNCLTPYQHGFMRNRSCQTNLISFYEEPQTDTAYLPQVPQSNQIYVHTFEKSMPENREGSSHIYRLHLGSPTANRRLSNLFLFFINPKALTLEYVTMHSRVNEYFEKLRSLRLSSQSSLRILKHIRRFTTYQMRGTPLSTQEPQLY